jgi:hypothetical protein
MLTARGRQPDREWERVDVTDPAVVPGSFGENWVSADLSVCIEP